MRFGRAWGPAVARVALAAFGDQSRLEAEEDKRGGAGSSFDLVSGVSDDSGSSGGAAHRLGVTTSRTDGPSGAPPIATAVRPLRRLTAPDEVHAPSRVDVVETLATLLDLTGSMALAAHLDTPDVSAPGKTPVRVADVDCADWVEDRLTHITAVVERRLSDLPTSRSSVWGAERMIDEIEGRGLLRRRRARDVARLARDATDAHVLAVRGVIERIRGEVRGLRAELGPRLVGLGPDAARLEALDALVARARAAGTQRLLGRLPAALLEAFEARLAVALVGLDEGNVRERIEAAYAADGFVSRHYGDSERSVAALLAHERAAIEALVSAAQELAATEARH